MAEGGFGELLEGAHFIAMALDVEGRVAFASRHLATLLGWEREALTGASWFDSCLPRGQSETMASTFVARLRAGAIRAQEDSEIVTRQGERRLISWSHTILRDEAGHPTGTASIGVDVTDRRRAEGQYDALHDELTGLPNRALLVDRAAAALTRAKRRGSYGFAVLLVDLDGFRLVNDSLGHTQGDRLLVAIGKALRDCVGAGDTVARLGGDEFAILLDDVEDPSLPVRLASAIHEELARPFGLGDAGAEREVYATASIGIAVGGAGYEQASDILRDAELAMSRAKAQGRAGHQVFDKSMHENAIARLQLETDLRRVVEQPRLPQPDLGALFVEYQAIVDLESGGITGFEALARWRHPTRGLVEPAEFIPAAEETGLIVPLGERVLREACLELGRWRRVAGAPRVRLAVNLSTKQLAQADLVAHIDAILDSSGLSPSDLELEITESVILAHDAGPAAALAALRERGIRLSIDDFGTGYSSLSYLARLPVDLVKIDRTFVHDIDESEQSARIVRAIVHLARDLGLDVIAEGIETEEQLGRLRELGCRRGQGFLFARPVAGEEALRLLAGRRLGAAEGP